MRLDACLDNRAGVLKRLERESYYPQSCIPQSRSDGGLAEQLYPLQPAVIHYVSFEPCRCKNVYVYVIHICHEKPHLYHLRTLTLQKLLLVIISNIINISSSRTMQTL